MEGRSYRFRDDEQAHLKKVIQPNAFEEYYKDFPKQAVPIVEIRAADSGDDYPNQITAEQADQGGQ